MFKTDVLPAGMFEPTERNDFRVTLWRANGEHQCSQGCFSLEQATKLATRWLERLGEAEGYWVRPGMYTGTTATVVNVRTGKMESSLVLRDGKITPDPALTTRPASYEITPEGRAALATPEIPLGVDEIGGMI